ncbi:MAG: hypothetical protein O3C40_05925 [Planctomycetota bacterium]|nr:hypothetical protein [Planctomycetota bacterium]
MRRRIACLLLCLLFQHAASVRAEVPPATSLLARSRWVQFQIVLGRIEVANIQSSQTRTATSGGEGVDLFEKLTISGDTDTPSVRYERVTPSDLLIFKVINGNRVEIDRAATRSRQVVPVRFLQPPGGDIELRVGAESDSQTYRAPTLWHLMVGSPEVCETHLLPLLKVMQPGWRFEEVLSRAMDELIREADASDFALRHTARRSIAKLNSPTFATRQLAQQQLIQLGVGILPYLNQISTSELTREQQRRLEHVRVDLRGEEADSPERLAMWLVEDERIWVSMLAHDELPIRKMAAGHLAKRFPNPIGFDPEGTPLERTQQVARIRTRIERH